MLSIGIQPYSANSGGERCPRAICPRTFPLGVGVCRPSSTRCNRTPADPSASRLNDVRSCTYTRYLATKVAMSIEPFLSKRPDIVIRPLLG